MRTSAAAVPDPAVSVSILERRRSALDNVSPEIADGPLNFDGAVDLTRARRIRHGGARPAWIAPSADGEAVCIVAAGELGCATLSDVADDGAAIMMSWHADTPVRVTGITGDDVGSVTVVSARGDLVEAHVEDNSFFYESAQAPREVRWTGPRGRASFLVTPIPGR